MEREGAGRATIIVYRLGPGSPARVTRFAERILGQDRKRNGKIYRRKGLLDAVPHWKVGPGVVVVERKNQRRVVREIRKWTDQVHAWPVSLSRKQARLLSPLSR